MAQGSNDLSTLPLMSTGEQVHDFCSTRRGYGTSYTAEKNSLCTSGSFTHSQVTVFLVLVHIFGCLIICGEYPNDYPCHPKIATRYPVPQKFPTRLITNCSAIQCFLFFYFFIFLGAIRNYRYLQKNKSASFLLNPPPPSPETNMCVSYTGPIFSGDEIHTHMYAFTTMACISIGFKSMFTEYT